MARRTSARSAITAGSTWVRSCQHKEIVTLCWSAGVLTGRSPRRSPRATKNEAGNEATSSVARATAVAEPTQPGPRESARQDWVLAATSTRAT